MSIGTQFRPESNSFDAEQPLSRAAVPSAPRALSAAERVVSEGIRRFDAWLENVGYASYDPYDSWGTKYGLLSRRIYYKKGLLGLPLIAPILLMEVACPGV